MNIKIFDYNKKYESKIIVYGSKELQHIVTWCLNKYGFDVYCYANKDGRRESTYDTISLDKLAKMITEDTDIIVLFAVRDFIRSQIKLLESSGIKCIYSVRKLLDDSKFEEFNKDELNKEIFAERRRYQFFEDSMVNEDKLYIKSIDAMVTERCSLRCEGCSNLMQYYKKPKNLDIDKLCSNIEQIVKRADEVIALRILGGEPFMNPEFIKVVDSFRDSEKIIDIEIYSNATIFPNEEILNGLKCSKVFMILSDYGSLSRKMSDWIEWCKNNEVRYTVIKMDVWQDCGKLERHDYTEQELMDVYANCTCRNVPTVLDGKLYNCAYAANAANLGAMYAEEMRRDYLEIDDNLTSKDIDDFLYNRRYLEACRYCNGRNANRAKIVPHIQTNKPLEYKMLSTIEMKKDKSDVVYRQASEKISVIVPTYNVENYIDRCLKSIRNQTYNNIEILIVDDGSKDNTINICRKYTNDTRIRIIECEHTGVSHARKIGISETTGEVIAFVDADDYIDPDYLENMIHKMDECDLISSGYWEEDTYKMVSDLAMDRGQSASRIKKPDFPEKVYSEKAIENLWKYMFSNLVFETRRTVWGRLFKADMLKEVSQFMDDRIWMGEDRLLYQLYMLKCHKVKYVNEYGYHYCVRPRENRYPWEMAFENSYFIKNVLMKAIENHPLKEMLSEGVNSDYISFNKLALQFMGVPNKYYYPYYGRLDGKRVILYGAGNVGKSYYSSLLKDDGVVLKAWIDKNAEVISETEMLPVKPTEILDELEYDYIVVAVASKVLFEAIKEELMERGVAENKLMWNKTKILGE